MTRTSSHDLASSERQIKYRRDGRAEGRLRISANSAGQVCRCKQLISKQHVNASSIFLKAFFEAFLVDIVGVGIDS